MPRKRRKPPTYLTLPAVVARMAKMEAARRGTTVSDYIADLVREDCQRTGVADLAVNDADQGGRHER